jgi:hypothetical protein
MVGFVGPGRASAGIKPKWKIQLGHRYIPVTRVWVTEAIKGVPVGMQTAWLSINNSGKPLLVTRTADVTYWAVTQGPFAAGGGGKVQPATAYMLVSCTVGRPFTSTRGFGVVGVACPAWTHITVAPT